MTEDDTVLEMTSDEVQKSKTPPRLKRRRFAPIKIANQIPMRRRKEIEKALGEVGESPTKWSRKDGTKTHIFLRKRIKPGTIRHIEYD